MEPPGSARPPSPPPMVGESDDEDKEGEGEEGGRGGSAAAADKGQATELGQGTSATTFSVKLLGEGRLMRTFEIVGTPPPLPPPPKRRRGAAAQLEVAQEEVLRLHADNERLRRSMGAAAGDALLKVEEKEAVRVKDCNTLRGRVAEAKAKAAAAEGDASKAANTAVHEQAKLRKRIDHLTRAMQHKQEEQVGQIRTGIEQREQLRRKMKGMISAELYDAQVEELKLATNMRIELEQGIMEMEQQMEQLQDELDIAAAGPGAGRYAETNAMAYLTKLKAECGIRPLYASVPPRTSTTKDGKNSSVRHMAAVMKGRGEGEDIELVADALHRCGYFQRLVECKKIQPFAKALVQGATAEIQGHWSARHAVHIWDRLELSRSQMETLSHLLSSIYNPVTDTYDPICIWENPHDPTDFVLAARLAGRWSREREYHAIASKMNIVVGANGRCERDAVRCTELLYTTYAGALRQDYTTERPAQPVLYLDGTGGPLGKGLCHGELGCADFIAVGDSDAKQSRASLQPLFAYEGTDHTGDLRANLELSIDSYNRLVHDGFFDRVSFSDPSHTERIPARPMTAADMQGAKSTYGMNACSHSVWCKCKRGSGGSHFKLPDPGVVFDTYDELNKFIDEEVGCVIKSFDEMCSWAHYSPGVASGGKFTPFRCSCCGYQPTENKWRADLKAYHAMTDAEQALAQAAHRDDGDELNSHNQHHHQQLFTPPLPHHGMDRCGVDNLHLVYLNLFKHLFRYTVHEGLPPSKKKIIRDYCKNAGFYSYDARRLMTRILWHTG